MKKFNAEGPGYGLLDLAGSGSQLDVVLPPNVSPSAAWDAAFVRQEKPALAYRNLGKRALDLALVLLSAPFTLPVIAICAAALWAEGGVPFYRQKRLGLGKRGFSILKLRTMVRDADAVLEQHLAQDDAMRAEWDRFQKLKDDPRVTRVGAFLRASSLDELPQLWNVLKGEMSLVGPRPMMPEQEDMYGDMRAYTAVRPGITGLWQVSARNANSFVYRNEVDASYERSLTLGNDLQIIIKTFGVVLRRTGC